MKCREWQYYYNNKLKSIQKSALLRFKYMIDNISHLIDNLKFVHHIPLSITYYFFQIVC